MLNFYFRQAKILNLWSTTWYLTEYDPADKRAFGFVTGLQVDEWGYVLLEELESIKRPFELKIECDLYFAEKASNECLV
jgi:hypothetical protein